MKQAIHIAALVRMIMVTRRTAALEQVRWSNQAGAHQPLAQRRIRLIIAAMAGRRC
jgi:hypothetical protein